MSLNNSNISFFLFLLLSPTSSTLSTKSFVHDITRLLRRRKLQKASSLLIYNYVELVSCFICFPESSSSMAILSRCFWELTSCIFQLMRSLALNIWRQASTPCSSYTCCFSRHFWVYVLVQNAHLIFMFQCMV